MSFLQNIGLHTDSDVARIVKNEESRGASFNYTPRADPREGFGVIGDRPDFEFEKIDDALENEPILRAAVLALTDKVMEGGYHLKPLNEKSGIDNLRDKLTQTKFRTHLRHVVANLVLYNNCYQEIITNTDDKLEHLNVLDFAFTEPVTEKNGDVDYYKQDIPYGTEQFKDGMTRWEPEEVVHYRLDRFNTSTVPSSNVQALWDTILLKDYIRQWEQWFFRTNQMRPVVGVDNASQQSIDAFISTLEKLEQNIRAVIPIKGEFEIGHLQNYGELSDNLDELRDWCDTQILVCMRVPPIVVGRPNESGRSDAVEQRKNFYTRVNAIQSVIEEHVNSEMLPKAGFGRVEFSFGAIDSMQEKTAFENAQVMRKAQFTDEAIEAYLEQKGITFDGVDKVLLDKSDLAEMDNDDVSTGQEDMIGNESADEAESRERQADDTMQEANQE